MEVLYQKDLKVAKIRKTCILFDGNDDDIMILLMISNDLQ